MTPDNVFQIAAERLESEFHRCLPLLGALQASIQGEASVRIPARIRHEFVHREAIDAACEQWAQGGGFPALPPEQALCVWDRVVEARKLVLLLHPKGVCIQASSAEELLSWLLIHYWSEIGVICWQARLASVL